MSFTYGLIVVNKSSLMDDQHKIDKTIVVFVTPVRFKTVSARNRKQMISVFTHGLNETEMVNIGNPVHRMQREAKQQPIESWKVFESALSI